MEVASLDRHERWDPVKEGQWPFLPPEGASVWQAAFIELMLSNGRIFWGQYLKKETIPFVLFCLFKPEACSMQILLGECILHECRIQKYDFWSRGTHHTVSSPHIVSPAVSDLLTIITLIMSDIVFYLLLKECEVRERWGQILGHDWQVTMLIGSCSQRFREEASATWAPTEALCQRFYLNQRSLVKPLVAQHLMSSQFRMTEEPWACLGTTEEPKFQCRTPFPPTPGSQCQECVLV